jgi:hypothetical protein
MAAQEQTLQICPTRIDGSPVMFAHKVDRARCQDRQRRRYHKCFTCAWNNGYVAAHGEPTPGSEPVRTDPGSADVEVMKVG